MISSLTIVFLATCYLYFKHYYENLIETRLADEEQKRIWKVKLTKKLMIIPAGMIIIVVLYMCSFTIMRLWPDLSDVKFIRRVTDVASTIICLVLFYLDKRELDKKLTA